MRNAESENKVLTKAKHTAYRLLTYRPRSRRELEEKLNEREFSEDVVKSIIDQCVRLGYIDDAQFARQWALSRIRLRGFGRRRIEQELRNKGINRDIIREILGEVFQDSSETDIARREAEKKMKNLTRFEPEIRRRRLAGFLERRGFSSEIISFILRDIR